MPAPMSEANRREKMVEGEPAKSLTGLVSKIFVVREGEYTCCLHASGVLIASVMGLFLFVLGSVQEGSLTCQGLRAFARFERCNCITVLVKTQPALPSAGCCVSSAICPEGRVREGLSRKQ